MRMTTVHSHTTTTTSIFWRDLRPKDLAAHAWPRTSVEAISPVFLCEQLAGQARDALCPNTEFTTTEHWRSPIGAVSWVSNGCAAHAWR